MKKITKAQQAKNEKKAMKKKDEVWSKAVKDRDNNKCIICGKTNYLNSHHIIPREKTLLRWNVDNGITLCVGHHKFSLDISPHRNGFVFFLWLQKFKPIQFQLLKKFKPIQFQLLKKYIGI